MPRENSRIKYQTGPQIQLFFNKTYFCWLLLMPLRIPDSVQTCLTLQIWKIKLGHLFPSSEPCCYTGSSWRLWIRQVVLRIHDCHGHSYYQKKKKKNSVPLSYDFNIVTRQIYKIQLKYINMIWYKSDLHSTSISFLNYF